MKVKIINNSDLDLADIKPLLGSFLPFALKRMQIQKPMTLKFASDPENAGNPLGKTAHYEPNDGIITVFTDNRHIKDILRSLSHEMVHHKQNCDGKLDDMGSTEPGYAQNDDYLRGMEEDAYKIGNICLRDWEDQYKNQLQETIYYTKQPIRSPKMDYKEWRNAATHELLMERWGLRSTQNEPENTICEEVVEEETQESRNATIREVIREAMRRNRDKGE